MNSNFSGGDTVRLYYDDATLARFSATVTEVAQDGRVVYLDRTAFYPTSGGQPHDLGTIADVALTDVVDEEARIAHHLAQPLGLPVGAMVVGQVDMVRRFDHMQQHTGQHLLSALLADEYGWPTVSVHFGDESSTVDVTAEGVSTEQLAAIEHRANVLTVQNHAVTVSYEDAASATGLRKPSDRDGTLRIVTIEGLDRSACGGTHVTHTAQIGAVLLRRAEKTRGHVRIEFLCGHRAVRRARLDADLLSRTARPLSAAPADLPVLVEQQQSRLVELERDRKRLLVELAQFEAQQLWQAAPIDVAGVRRIATTVGGPVKEAEPLAQALLKLGGCAVLITNTANGGVLLATAPDTGLDAGQLLRAALQSVGGRGGGAPRLAQGAVTSPTSLGALADALGF
jgi:alanyl-tRNA synthetase